MTSTILFFIIYIFYINCFPLNGNLQIEKTQLTLFGSWQGKVTVHKYGNTVTLYIDSVTNTANGQILAYMPAELRSSVVAAGVVFDTTDKTTVNRLSIIGTQLAICNFDFSNWYAVGHVYTGTITYVV